MNKTVFLLACFAWYRHLSLGCLNGLCSKSRDFSFSLCAVDSFPQIPLIHFFLNNFSVYSRFSLLLSLCIKIRLQYLRHSQSCADEQVNARNVFHFGMFSVPHAHKCSSESTSSLIKLPARKEGWTTDFTLISVDLHWTIFVYLFLV